MTIDKARAAEHLAAFDFGRLFVDVLGWDRHAETLEVILGDVRHVLRAVAHKRGLVAWVCSAGEGERIPEKADRRRIETQVARHTRENLIVFHDGTRSEQVWCWARREPGRPATVQEHFWYATSTNRAFVRRLEMISFSLEEELRLTLLEVTTRTQAAFDVESVTRRFFDEFKSEHKAFLEFITGIEEVADREWYASIMLNRMMFVYFIQRKGFLDGDRDYLRNKLALCRARCGEGEFYSFYRYFLLRLFHDGLGAAGRSAELDALLGRVPYLNGGLFERHPIEERNPAISIPDEAFERIFAYFDRYRWHLDERPLRNDDEINPDVLGYIFEKYINQKQMGAYYTREDITGYISRNTVLPFVLAAAREECRVAFENNGPTVWDHLRIDPDRYITPSMRFGAEYPLPADVEAGVGDASRREEWNRAALPPHGLPNETWRDVVERRSRLQQVRTAIRSGSVKDVDSLTSWNLDVRQFAQDLIERCDGLDLLRAVWKSVQKVTVLDPTCGSGAFLFAVLEIMEPLYEACLSRMEAFVADADRFGDARSRARLDDFRRTLDNVAQHPNARYYILKSIILNNLFGVDIMEEAVEICKLRLFLKLAAQVEPDPAHPNLGIEPLPDIDFNIRAGNTLVGYSSFESLRAALASRLALDGEVEEIERDAAEVRDAAAAFRRVQVERGGAAAPETKRGLRERLATLEARLNRHFCREYGLDPTDPEVLSKWIATHRPFHWLVEFHGIMSGGGFDVVIGNPPFVEYSKVRGAYTVRNDYRTLPSGNLYALVLERSYDLCAPGGRVGLIVPLSLVCTTRTETIRALVRRHPSWLSSYDMRPATLFDGVAQRLTIVLSRNERTDPPTLRVGGYRRWTAEERPFLMDRTWYVETASVPGGAAIPKVVSATENEILRKIAGPSVEMLTVRRGGVPIVVHRIVRYFIKALDFVPHFVNASGMASRSADYKEFKLDRPHAAVVTALLNSNLFYWFWRTHSDGFHCGYGDVYAMPFRPPADAGMCGRLATAVEHLMEDLKRTSVRKSIRTRAGTIQYQEFYPSQSKAFIDVIDRTLAPHFRFTADELDFLLNYDAKYRATVEEEQADADLVEG